MPCNKKMHHSHKNVSFMDLSIPLNNKCNRPALYFCNYKENKKNNTRMLDTLFIEDFIDSMEEYLHF